MTDSDERMMDRDRDFADEASGRWDTDPVTATAGIGADTTYLTADVADDAMDDPEVDALVVDIEATRAEMSQTVDELGDRLDPANVAGRAGQAVREATVGKIETKVNDMTTTASDLASNAGQTAQQAGSGLIETIRRNPIPAAMTGIGLGMMIMNRQSSKSGSGSWSRGQMSGGYGYGSSSYRGTGSDWMSGDTGYQRGGTNGNGIGDTIGRRAGDASETVRGAAEQASETVRDAADQARRQADQTMNQVGQTANEAMTNLSTTATDVMSQAQRAVQSNPLAFGALAVAVGTAVGLAIPASNAERRVMGPTGGQLIDKVENAVSQPLEQMQQQG
ncbi:MAG TPA: DUF3618 domain-containing protein [Candidatus Limnocylindrales bacterium]|nr:DUF3618 domain-containing protein [Candidatus Limnocylindrales bacterium]